MAIFVTNFQNHIWIEIDEFLKIREFTLVIIFVSFPQNRQFWLQNEIFEISRNSAYVKTPIQNFENLKWIGINPFTVTKFLIKDIVNHGLGYKSG